MSSHYYRNAKSLASAGAAASAAVEPSTKTPKRMLIGQSIKSSSSSSSRSSRSLLAFAFLLLLSAAVLNSCVAIAAAEAESAPPAAAVNGGKTEDKEAAVVGDDEAELGGAGGSLMAVKRAAPRTYNFGLGKRGGGGGGGGGGNGVNPSDLLFTKDKLIDFLLRQQNGAAGSASNGAAAPSSYYYQSSPGGYVDNYGLQAALYVPESLGIKRSKPQRFSFGLGKRTWALRGGEGGEGEVAQEDNIEAGESPEEAAAEADANGRDKRKAERYQFGLGKRSPFAWFTSTSGNGSPKSSRSIDEFKRRYNFGLGK